MRISDENIREYYDSLSEHERYEAFSLMVWMLVEGDLLHYSPEEPERKIYWDADGIGLGKSSC